MPKKRRRKLQPPDPVCYLVAIENWDWCFSFGVDNTWRSDRPYSDYRHLKVEGSVLRPYQVKDKATDARLAFLPSPDLNEPYRSDLEPLSVGSLSVYDGVLHGLLSMPADALTPVLQLLATNHMKYVILDGPPLRYRKAAIRHFSIHMTIDEDDYFSDE